ncbi:MAG: DUF1365 domain-containing protein [Pseudomonadota bacterium]
MRLFDGRTVHARFTPFEQRFSYRLFLIDIDIDRLEAANRQSALFSVDRPNLFSFRRKDHGPKDGSTLRPWATDMFGQADIDLNGGPIRLTTFPRHLFYKFAPISLWFGYGPDGALRGLIYEVNNTFGETHCYVATIGAKDSCHEAKKRFHVSPFFDVSGRYRFTLREPHTRLSLVVDTLHDADRTHTATMTGRAIPATDAAFARASLARPLSTLGVTAGIHWEALKIWRKGAKYRSKPAAPIIGHTIARSAQPLASETKSAAL